MCKDFNEFCVCKDAVMVPAALEHAAASAVRTAIITPAGTVALPVQAARLTLLP